MLRHHFMLVDGQVDTSSATAQAHRDNDARMSARFQRVHRALLTDENWLASPHDSAL